MKHTKPETTVVCFVSTCDDVAMVCRLLMYSFVFKLAMCIVTGLTSRYLGGAKSLFFKTNPLLGKKTAQLKTIFFG